MRIFVTIIITVGLPFAHWTCSLNLFNKHAVVRVVAWARTQRNSIHSLLSAGERVSHCFDKNAFPTILMLPLSFNTNYNDITALRQSTYRAIILAKIFSCAPSAGFPHFLEAFPFSFLMKYTPLLVR